MKSFHLRMSLKLFELVDKFILLIFVFFLCEMSRKWWYLKGRIQMEIVGFKLSIRAIILCFWLFLGVAC